MATRYSLVVPVYRNEETIPDLLDALVGVDRALGGALEVVFVVDGSPDRSLAVLVEALPRTGLTAKLLEMSRNFGAFAAIRAGSHRSGGPVFRGDGGRLAGAAGARGRILPPPRARHLRRGLRRARGARRSVGRRGSRRRCSGPPIAGSSSPRCRAAASTSSAATSRARDALVALTESHSSLIGQLVWIGMRREEVPYHRRARQRGKSAWTWRKKLAYMLDSSLAFSDLPITSSLRRRHAGARRGLVYGTIVLVARLDRSHRRAGLCADGAADLRLRRAQCARALRRRRVRVAGVREHEGAAARHRAAAVHVRRGRTDAASKQRAGRARAQGRQRGCRTNETTAGRCPRARKRERSPDERVPASAGDLRDRRTSGRARASGPSRMCCPARASAPTATSATTRSSRTTSRSATASR